MTVHHGVPFRPPFNAFERQVESKAVWRIFLTRWLRPMGICCRASAKKSPPPSYCELENDGVIERAAVQLVSHPKVTYCSLPARTFDFDPPELSTGAPKTIRNQAKTSRTTRTALKN